MTNQRLIENKVRRIVREVLSEGPNNDQQIRLVKLIQSLCGTFLKLKMSGLDFSDNMNKLMKDFKKTTGG